MEITGNEDLRVRKTITAIHDAFTELLAEMPYEKITVKTLCDRAMVNKTTFYRYYPTLDDLLAEIQSQYARPYVKLTAGLRYPRDVEAIVRAFMEYSASQGPLYDTLISSGTYAGIMHRVLDEMGVERQVSTSVPEGWTEDEWLLYVTHVNASQIHYYRTWIESGRKLPVDEMVDLAVKLICDGTRMQ